MLTAELEQEFNDFFAMFRSPGWQRLMEIMKENLAANQNLDYLNTSEELWKAKGMNKVLTNLINLEEFYLERQRQVQEAFEDEDD